MRMQRRSADGRRGRRRRRLGERERFGQQVANAGLVVDDEHARTGIAGRRTGWRRQPARPQRHATAARTLAVEPRVDVALAEPPLPSDADRWNFPGFDQPVHRPQIHLEYNYPLRL
jgi:hypothetical protein